MMKREWVRVRGNLMKEGELNQKSLKEEVWTLKS
jgi:hypothetical protein